MSFLKEFTMILSCSNISKAFGSTEIIRHASFHIEDHEKAAIVGINGAGKTTLLRIIVGEMTPDDGQVVLARDKTLGYLAQNSTVDTSHTIYEELLSVKADLLRLEEKIRECENNMKHAEGDALEDLMKQYTSLTHAFETGGGYLYRSELVGVLKGLGFTEDEFSKPVATLSGGQKTRVALGRLLLQNPDLIILDEPTNHLDMNSIAWLETYLLNYKGAVLIVSHDRYFLDRIAGKVIEIDQSKATTFMGNYSDYAVKKEQLRVAAWNAYMNQQREIIYAQRRQVLDGLDIKETVLNMMHTSVSNHVALAFGENQHLDAAQYHEMLKGMEGIYFAKGAVEFSDEEIPSKTQEDFDEAFIAAAEKTYEAKEQEVTTPIMRELERVIMLRVVDEYWMDHIDAMDDLKQGVRLQGYGNNNPVDVYKRESLEMFEEMVSAIQDETVRRLYSVRLRKDEEVKRERVAKATVENVGGDGTTPKKQPVKKTVKIGRNDPCPCGSGLKWKKCTCKEYHPDL